jgi:hypothetical protein
MGGMSDQPEIHPSRRRLRFSLRILLILLTIACLYLGCWFPTATTGARAINARYSRTAVAKAPLLLASDVYESLTEQQGGAIIVRTRRARTWYFWCFGLTVELLTTQGFHDPPAGTALPDENPFG